MVRAVSHSHIHRELMPRRCTICTHKSRSKIDRALVERRPFRAIARQHSVSKDALVRHFDDHLPAALVKAQEAIEAAQADALLAQVVDLRDKALGVLDKAEKSDDLRIAVSAIREARGCVELLAKLAGQLKDRKPTFDEELSLNFCQLGSSERTPDRSPRSLHHPLRSPGALP